jgi:Flp pilus assembly protein TadD
MGKRSRAKTGRERRVEEAPPRPVEETSTARNLLVCAIIVALIAVIFLQVRNHQFTNLDDPIYITDNDRVKQGLTAENIRWAFTSFDFNWHPMTWLTHLADVELFGLDAGRHLLVNVLFHTANTLLLFFLVQRATGAVWRSALVAAIFAVHPLHVESVAWVAERKDVLSGLFFMLTLWFYIRYARTSSRLQYVLALASLALGLMSKGMLVTVPFVLLLLDYWPLNRWERTREVLIEKIPFLAVIIPGIIVTIIAQREAEALMTTEEFPLGQRIANAILSYGRYLAKTIWPAGLAVPYPYEYSIDPLKLIASLAVLIALTALVWRHRRRRYLVTGWFWFVGMLVPVIGLVQIGMQAMADRYTYLPMIGLSLAAVWFVSEVVSTRDSIRKPLFAAAIAIVAVLTVTARVQAGYWRDSETLFRHALAVTDRNMIAHSNLGNALMNRSQYQMAADEFQKAVAISSRNAEALNGLGTSRLRLGDTAEAERLFKASIEANPRNATAYHMLGEMALAAGKTDEAKALLEKAIAIRPKAETRAMLALAAGNLNEAIARYEEALRADPRSPEARNSLAAVLARSGRDAEALAQYEEALKLAPEHYDANMNLGALLSRLDRQTEAIVHFNAAARARPQSTEPRVYLALVYAQIGRIDAAAEQIAKAMATNHDQANADLTNALRLPARPNNIDEYLGFLERRRAGSGGPSGIDPQ